MFAFNSFMATIFIAGYKGPEFKEKLKGLWCAPSALAFVPSTVFLLVSAQVLANRKALAAGACRLHWLTLQNNLRSVDFSSVLLDVMTIADEVDSQLKQAMLGFMETSASMSASSPA
jgi:hypothetical protein